MLEENSLSFPLVFVSSYSSFSDLAHKPQGSPSPNTLHIFRLDLDSYSLTLLSVSRHDENLAFLRYSQKHNILYGCSESITREDRVTAFSVLPTTGFVSPLRQLSSSGKSACYLTLNKSESRLLIVNYWDSSIATLPISPAGLPQPASSVYKPARSVVAGSREDHLNNRHSEPHAHALVLDPIMGRMAYIPDLGEDDIKQFIFDEKDGRLIPAGKIKDLSNSKVHNTLGPRYLDFHPTLPVAYLVNEISSTVSVFSFKEAETAEMIEEYDSNPDKSFVGVPTLQLLQEIETIPKAFPKELNTCGRITVDPTGKFVLVSNRGHNSIAIFRISWGVDIGRLTTVGFFHTRGSTPRHFQFSPCGKALIVANQDTDTVSVFAFDNKTGNPTFTGNSYFVPSPNFVCAQIPHLNAHHSSKL